jgi:hypothetical protein
MDQNMVHLRQADEIGLVSEMAVFCDRMLVVFMSTNLKAILLNIKQNLDQRVLYYRKIVYVLCEQLLELAVVCHVHCHALDIVASLSELLRNALHSKKCVASTEYHSLILNFTMMVAEPQRWLLNLKDFVLFQLISSLAIVCSNIFS